MASINVVSADEDTQKSTNPDQFANIRTGDPDQSTGNGPEADAKLEETESSGTDIAPEADSDEPAEKPSADEVATETKPSETAPAAEEEPVPAGPDPEPETTPPAEEEPSKSEVPPAAPAVAAAGAAGKVTSGTGAKDRHLGRLLFELFLVIVIAGLAYWGYGLKQDNDKLTTENKNLVAENSKLNSNPAIIAQKESDTILLAVAKLVKLPVGETPTIANVTDAAAAKKQSAFFANAQNGDKVLFYVKTGQAILYRPSTNTIVAQGPLTINNTSTSTKKQ